ncbi:MAG TPA: type II toxin-antitoxin system VapC family toxin [Candidatus Bathyarchaeota archaeon]|nr:type II toxin-antitoxin system VapC family toxin [Candidatus Bathyarchaeota archaeon]
MKLFAQEEGWEKVLAKIEDGEMEGAISVVTLTEIYYKYLREGGPDLAKARIDILRYAIYLKKLMIGVEAAVKAGEFKGKYNIPIADALIAASAYLDDLIIISDDPDFKKVKEVKTLTEEELAAYIEGTMTR